jgi:transposase
MEKRIYREAGSSLEAHDDATQELVRLRKENAILRQEREILKRAATFFAKEGNPPFWRSKRRVPPP